MSQVQIEAFLALAAGFAFAGFVAALYRAMRAQPVSFSLLGHGGMRAAMAIPLLAAAGPAIIMRNTIRGRRYERRSMVFVWLATVIASIWSIAIGFQVMRLVAGFAG